MNAILRFFDKIISRHKAEESKVRVKEYLALLPESKTPTLVKFECPYCKAQNILYPKNSDKKIHEFIDSVDFINHCVAKHSNFGVTMEEAALVGKLIRMKIILGESIV